MSFIEVKNVCFSYYSRQGEIQALDNLSLKVEKGSFVTIIGSNGSGKSTFTRLLNSLEKPKSGTVFIDGVDTSDDKNIAEIRKKVGLVFQNPDNQIVGDTVEEDVAFGPENLGLKPNEIENRIKNSLCSLGIENLRNKSTSSLSGGQKQKLAIASAMAMGSSCLVLDESTSMLDPQSREETLNTLHKLNKENNTTIILVTHHVLECIGSDTVFVFDKGKVKLSGTPREVFSNIDDLKELGIKIPLTVELSRKFGVETSLTQDELIERIRRKPR